MTTNTTTDYLAVAAAWAARSLKSTGHANLNLCPGDATRYDVSITLVDRVWLGADNPDAPSTGAVIALVNFGTSCYWSGGYMVPSYMADKLGNGNEATGRVMAEFLNELAQHLPIDLLTSGVFK